MSYAGRITRVEPAGRWIAALPEVERDLYRSNRPDLAWDEEYGDRRIELVFIGRELDRGALVERLDGRLADGVSEAVAGGDDGSSADGGPFPGVEGDPVEFESG
jgi:hypothetical protein